MERKKVLIFPSGSEGAIDIYNSLKYNLHFEVYGFSGKKNFTDFAYPDGMYYYGDERLFVNHPEFEETFIGLLEQFGIDFIIPTFDGVALRLMEIEDKLPARVISSPYETTLVASDKKRMYDKVKDLSFAPKCYEVVDDVDRYPVFVKPSIGVGSQGIHLVNNHEQLVRALDEEENAVICEYLPGEEISVDCFTNRHGMLLFIGPRIRERIFHGITFRAKSMPCDEEIGKIASELNSRFSFRGAWFFQVKRSLNGELKLLEFSARQSTNSSFYGKRGVNLSLLSLFDAMDMDVDIIDNECDLKQERHIKASYKFEYTYSKVYIDFDDTIIVHGQVNTLAMRFIYQCINVGKEVVLLTRHFEDIDESLKKYRIQRELFDEIIWIKEDVSKANYIKGKDCIFIDNYYKERMDVINKCGIPVFDVDAIDGLVDESRF